MRTFSLLAALALAIALAGCGDDDEGGGGSGGGSASSSGGGGETIALASPEDGSLKFDPTELTAPAGQVTIDYDNPSDTPHAVTIEGDGVQEKSETVTGGKASVSADLEAGTYTFYCPVGDHRDGGMEGTLTVE